MFDWLNPLSPARLVLDICLSLAFGTSVFTMIWGIQQKSNRLLDVSRWAAVVGSVFAVVSLIASLIQLYLTAREPAAKAIMSPNVFWYAATAALVLYWLRGAATIVYAALEITIGALSLALAASTPALTVGGQVIAVAAGVYVIIRGLDNLERGLPDRLRPYWLRIFPKRWPIRLPKLPDHGSEPPPDPASR